MKKIILVYIISCSIVGLQAQTQKEYDDKINELVQHAVSFYYTNHDSLSFYFKDIKNLAYKNGDIKMLYELYNTESWSAYYYGYLDTMKDNITTLDSLTQHFKDSLNRLPDKLYYKTQFNYTKGEYYNEILDYKKSRFFFNTIIIDFEKLNDTLLVNDLLSFVTESNIFMASMLKDENKYALSKDYLNKNIRLLDKKKEFLDRLNNTKAHLASIHSIEGNYKEAISILLETIPFYQSIKRNSHRVMSNYDLIINNYLKLNETDNARFYLNKLKIAVNDDDSMSHLYYKSYSKILSQENNYEDAISILNDYAINLSPELEENQIDIILNLIDIANLHLKVNNLKKALKNYNLALNQFSEDSINSTINQTIKFKILKNKANTLKNLKNYTTSLKTADIAISILDSLKPSFKTNSDKLFLIENAFPLFENGINSAYQLYKQTNDSKYIDRAFFYSEKSKSTLLLESLLSTQATEFANIPEDLIEKEKQLKAKIAFLEKRINKKSTPDLQDELFDVKQDHRNLIQNIELNYKRYYDLKYNTQVLSLKGLQKWLDNDTVLLSYFYGTHSIYIISVTKNSTDIELLKIDKAFETLLKDSYALLSNPKSNLGLLKTKTHQLYQKIIQQSLVKSPQEKLIIIPDGLLNYLPFGSLSVNDTDYLIENHAVTYANSATLLMQLQSKSQPNNQVLAFAPSFENSSTSALLSLPNNAKEIKQVLTYFNGEAFFNEKASLENFNSKNEDFGIIHLATHAILDDENPEYSYLAFSPNPESENSLYTNDLYNLELNANMVTLSACESGIGDLKRGEGMLSLARGFYFSGTSSIASTLWKVNDASSYQLMDGFYKNLSKGNTKGIALQKAKTNFINTNKDNALSHPYYWSGFIVSGNTSALTFSFKWQYIALALFVLIALGLLFYRKKRAN